MAIPDASLSPPLPSHRCILPAIALWAALATGCGDTGVGPEIPTGPVLRLDGRGEALAAMADIRPARDEGIAFACPPGRLPAVEAAMAEYLASLDIPAGLVGKRADRATGRLVFTLNTARDDSDTLSFKDRPEMGVSEATVTLPDRRGQGKAVRTVSQKEIVLALLQHGRLTEFTGAACDLEALKEHVGIRQNTVAWAENLEWGWPDGGPARWNRKYWRDGTPRPRVPVAEALRDVFINQDRYAIGCYTATKITMVQGALDYFSRVDDEPAKRRLVEERLAADREPLVAVEPGRMWDFDPETDPAELGRPGKLVKVQYGVAPKNFVPGDWVYFLNTDPGSKAKTGYEGSSAIYLGRSRFNDYYNDNNHAYTYREKLDEVYQWRNGVFSRSRDGDRIRPLTAEDLERLGKPPAAGGLVMDLRVSHYLFGHEELPALAAATP